MTDKPRGALKPVASGLTDVGRQRRHNEDHILVREDLGLYVVADGMGGHNAGNIASLLVATSLENFFQATQVRPAPESPEDSELHVDARRIAGGVRKANRDVFEISSTHHQHHGMGSTVVAMHIPAGADLAHIAHVGDSRCYRLRQGTLKQLTRDHSLINDALDIKPDLTEAELARLPKNIITRALGMKDQVKVDVRSEPIEPGDLFLLCSDGLSGMVNDGDIADVLGMAEQPVDACEVLVTMANDAGGTDNISAVVVRIADERPSIQTAPLTPRPPSIAPRPAESDIEVAQGALDEDVFSEPAHRVEIRALSTPPPPIGLPAGDEGGDFEPEAAEGDEHRPTIPFDCPVARCNRCRAELLIGNRFCVECGAPVLESILLSA